MQRLTRFACYLFLVSLPFSEPLAQLNVSVQVEHVSCNGLTNACSSVYISGGTSPYQISWQQGGQGYIRCGYGVGEYSVTVIDADSLEAFVPFQVYEPEVFISGFTTTSGLTCEGCDDGILTLEFFGGTAPFTYSILGESFSSDETVVEITGLAPGIYSVMAQDINGCASSSTALVDDH